ncbi:MAG: hypothetical protein COV91_04985 [Candidatus Taylorbacteria bacterium CG11_big_fil_rev_8_21_14_0_20_46_11]|uniref:Peptidoglycan binding-like domain-containing protein n=1 Tax=Candidatus Taylorbacteria bacterium CG11_big_fil_rev_8_21_14_0_20_46_11 TaxID=1975025 RepID=A0A2H0KAL9_9BACT|nr:MAG: hypothetical protein COV91_04985 [Candidatus Taylorbacteria bacterium CG11_big_fil_rev_8_21_14_0_20_46_11]
MTAHSFFKITTTDRRTISTTDIAPVTLESSCTDSLATYTFTSPANATTRTFTVTVNADTCTTGGTPGGSGGGGGGSSGGGGGSSGYVYIPPPAEPTSGATPPVPAVSVVVPVTTAVSSTPALPVITALLNLGKKNADVLTLQKILNSDSDTQIATSGAGSPGNETDYFGPATLKAVKAFQEKYGIAGPGEVGYGNVGPKTRAKLNSISSGTTATSPQTGTAEATIQKQIDDAMNQILLLQEQLKTAQ